MKSRTKKIVSISGTLMLLAMMAYVWVLYYPQALFQHSLTHRNITVYSETKIDSRWKNVIDQSLSLIQDSELIETQPKINVFLVANSKYRRLESLLARPVLAKASQNNVFLNGDIYLNRIRIRGPVLEMHLIRTLAHEMTHCLENARYGMSSTALDWKREGYAEYISHLRDRTAPDYRLSTLLEQYESHIADSGSSSEWMKISDGVLVPPLYVRWRLLVEYLMDVKGMSYDQIRTTSVSDAEVYYELRQMIKQKNGK
ncbi:hypothetical protein [Gimesia alba]|nr:hypothetical protein [Gimesia alba]